MPVRLLRNIHRASVRRKKKIVPRTKKLHETHNKAWCQQPSGLTAKHKPHDHNDSLFYQKMREKKKARFHAQLASPRLVLRTNGLLLETHQIRPRWPVSTTGQKLHTLSSLGRYFSHHPTKCSAVFLTFSDCFFCVAHRRQPQRLPGRLCFCWDSRTVFAAGCDRSLFALHRNG